jgi:hypothetical protein
MHVAHTSPMYCHNSIAQCLQSQAFMLSQQQLPMCHTVLPLFGTHVHSTHGMGIPQRP